MNNLGAWPHDNGVSFRVWAPNCETIEVVTEGSSSLVFPLKADSKNYFCGFIPDLAAGTLYKYRVDGKALYPDPCSRFQPQGPHGPSLISDIQGFRWEDQKWQEKGIELANQVIYELHVGAFSPQGTYTAITVQLDELKELGITTIELMPLAEFPGRCNWGYDGVSLFAPAHTYGTPDDLKHFINAAHQAGMGVVLDVVYNHLGPDGNYLKSFSQDYFSQIHTTDWGEALNYDGPNSLEVREFFINNACYWINEFHFDGLRFDATQNIYDDSHPHILAEIAKKVRESAFPKKIILIAENESQDTTLIKPIDEGGCGLDALWNDDFHHTAKVALTGRREAYYTDYTGHPQEFISLLKYGYLYQGQFYSWQDQVRGTVVEKNMQAANFIVYLQNHDQIANSLEGHRISHHSDPAVCRALTALWLLSPQTPLFFMGQEFGASSPFLFFADHNHKLAEDVFKGRKEFLSQFPSIKAAQEFILNPQDIRTFEMSKLKFEERKLHQGIYQLHKDLLKLRREDKVFRKQDRGAIDGGVIGSQAFVIRYYGNGSDRLLVVNLGPDHHFSPCPQPLLACTPQRPWKFLWSSEDIKYNGRGTVEAFTNRGWRIPAFCAQVFTTEIE